MRAFRAGQIESGKMPPYISICSRASRITSKTIFFLIEKEATEFVKKNSPVRATSRVSSFITCIALSLVLSATKKSCVDTIFDTMGGLQQKFRCPLYVHNERKRSNISFDRSSFCKDTFDAREVRQRKPFLPKNTRSDLVSYIPNKIRKICESLCNDEVKSYRSDKDESCMKRKKKT